MPTQWGCNRHRAPAVAEQCFRKSSSCPLSAQPRLSKLIRLTRQRTALKDSRNTAISPICAAAVAADAELLQTVDVSLGDRSYPIYIGQGILDHSNLLQRHVPGKKVLVVTNETVAPLYLDRYA